MDEQLKSLLEGINALKSGQDMQKSQEETKQEIQKFQQGMEKGLENVQKCQEDLKNSLEKIAVVEEKIAVVEEKIAVVEEKTKKEVYKTQFCIISEANGWTEGVKACQLAASLRGEAAEVLQTLPDTERLNLNSLCNALDLRFGQKYSKDYARLQMKTRLQKAGKKLAGEAATQASRRDRQSIGGARVTAVKPCEYRLLKEMEKLKEEMQTIKAGISNQEKRNFECWGYGGIGHLGRNCPRSRKDENTVSSSKQEN
ncbi:uncharacterized protein TNCV_1215471 [Trichonephila clavipes]|nr:uncharacterized protein TNCV_1215471 [Trichonephila clavipes]